MSIPPVPAPEPVEAAPAAEIAAPETPAVAAAEVAAPETPAVAAAPWAAKLAERFTDEAVREQVDAYLREEHQPYVTKVEQERAAARAEAEAASEKAWVFDDLNADPNAALKAIAEQVYGEDIATRIAELLDQGAAPAVAEATAVAEEADPEQIALDALPPEVREAVEFAKSQRAAQAAAEQAAVEETELAEATKVYDEWRAGVMAANPDIAEVDIHAYVYAADGDMEQGLANYRAAHPAPAAPVQTPPATLGGAGNGGLQPTRRMSSLAEAAGAVYDGAAGTVTI